ncbi:MAG: SulP family inorganic anion transporter [Anaerolineae bacterium]
MEQSRRSWLPFLGSMRTYDRDKLVGDVTAGIIVAIMLVPQGMAYALLADLPPEAGLYAAILPLLLYGLLGTSGALAVGPVAIVSLMTAEALVGAPDPEKLIQAVTLAAKVGAIQLVMGLLKAGTIVNFLSHPVLSGFASAAALVIFSSQIKHLLGLDIPRTPFAHEQVILAVQNAGAINPVTLALGLGSVAVLLFFRLGLPPLLARSGMQSVLRTALPRLAPLVVVAGATLIVWALDLNARAGVAIVGEVTSGLPPLTVPAPARIAGLAPAALANVLVGYMESISVDKALDAKRRQRIDPNQELIALGAANLGASLTGAYPVAGGLGRSAVNFSAGARTGLASIITAALLTLTVLFLMPLFTYLPQAALAAIIMVAVTALVDLETIRHTWQVNRADFAAVALAFAAVLFVGIEEGILIGVLASILLYLWRTSRPHIAVVGRLGESEHFRNVRNFPVDTCPHVLAIRVDESLYFANAAYLETQLLNAVAARPAITDVVLVCSAVNYVDTSAMETLETLIAELHGAGVAFHQAEVKVTERALLEKAHFFQRTHIDEVFLSTHEAMVHLVCEDLADG